MHHCSTVYGSSDMLKLSGGILAMAEYPEAPKEKPAAISQSKGIRGTKHCTITALAMYAQHEEYKLRMHYAELQVHWLLAGNLPCKHMRKDVDPSSVGGIFMHKR
jgi:hypothetical protein